MYAYLFFSGAWKSSAANSNEEEIVAYVDKDKIEKIATNLLSNAFKFTPQGGRIEFGVKKMTKHTP